MLAAYDLQDLVHRLGGRGLNLTEDAVKGLIEDVFTWTEDSIRLSATPFDDVALVVLPTVKGFALAAADKIDGQVG